MSITFSRNMVQQSYDYLTSEIKDLQDKKAKALALGEPVGGQLAKMIDIQIAKVREDLEGVKYALSNMT